MVKLAGSSYVAVAIEAIAALANLAVNDANEVQIARDGGLVPILEGAESPSIDLQSMDRLRPQSELTREERRVPPASSALRRVVGPRARGRSGISP